ncbi:MAG TPA: AbrB/MazE/SpoVT family DNA-binding domain-containing protein [Nitrososphaerales archaeon]|nr:AbrB/MazE/SpoVT family DNA-binding domain-containing protein [Nitrososphaerales archaeon]
MLIKVNSNYQVTIPKEVREKAKISKGDTVMVEYDEEEAVVRARPPMRGRRSTFRLGARLTVKEIEESIERGQTD